MSDLVEATIREVEAEIGEIEASKAGLRRCLFWLRSPAGYGDVVRHIRGGEQYVVVDAPVDCSNALEFIDGKPGRFWREIPSAFFEPSGCGDGDPWYEVVGHYDGPGLPPKPREAEWADAIKRGEPLPAIFPRCAKGHRRRDNMIVCRDDFAPNVARDQLPRSPTCGEHCVHWKLPEHAPEEPAGE
jgi:hypothetical protein